MGGHIAKIQLQPRWYSLRQSCTSKLAQIHAQNCTSHFTYNRPP